MSGLGAPVRSEIGPYQTLAQRGFQRFLRHEDGYQFGRRERRMRDLTPEEATS
jgi:hypothetical protein